jgi:hypothetical protein
VFTAVGRQCVKELNGTRFKEHLFAVKSNNNSAKSTERLLQNCQFFGKIENVMQIIHSNKKCHYIIKDEEIPYLQRNYQ